MASVRAVAAAALTLLAVSAAAQGVVTPSVADAFEHPYAFAWQMLADSSSPRTVGTRSVAAWERWDSPADIFVTPPQKPHWPTNAVPAVSLQDEFMLRMPAAANALTSAAVGPCSDSGDLQQPHLNYPAYQYIVTNDLWTQAGLGKWFASGREVAFPPRTLTLKAEWQSLAYLKPDQRARYFPQLGGASTEGLIALHISSRVTPDWFWATFEHVDNPCLKRSSYIQSDRFGYPNYAGLAPAGATPSARLQALLQQYKLGQVWLNYRLVGVQTAYLDLRGTAQRLGNGAIEGPLATTASCMTCHAQARMNSTGRVQPPLLTCGDDGYTGVPSSLWLAGMRQLDFVWAFLEMPSAQPPSGNCGMGGLGSAGENRRPPPGPGE